MEMHCPFSGETIRKSVSSKWGSESHFLTEFEELGLIGRGGFGIVTKCKNHLDNCIYAVKVVPLKSANMPFQKVLREVRALGCLRHPNIVRYHQAWLEENFSGISCSSAADPLRSGDSYEEFDFDSPCLYIQMEFCPRSLEKFLETSGDLDKDKAWKIFLQIVDGLVEVHAAGIVHRDLSPANILLDEHDDIRISDFGLAKLVNGVNDEVATGSIGHQLYTAPELKDKQMEVDTNADIYSLGLIFVELFHPISTQHERIAVFQNLRVNKEFPKSWKYEEHKCFVQQLLSTIPSERPTANGILQQQAWASSSSQGEEDVSPDEFKANFLVYDGKHVPVALGDTEDVKTDA
ncbi:eIF-2-alpha kinase GCN2-like [Cornus florida]|uniref:eIF-2-alpha kinase GCN2-like n=1 Tax=Cornus florida TaxID=4283 RepID=UPI0028A2D872|nr:eIF-2-alpha kinase GCN2-like [Cornus florida]